MVARTQDMIVIILYLIGMLAIGLIVKKRVKTADSFLVADRNLGFGLFFPCMCALVLGGASTIGTVKLGYLYGISGASLVVMLGLGTIALGAIMSSKLVRLKILTIGQLLGIRFGSGSRVISSAILSVYLIMLSVVQVIACGTIIHALLGWDIRISMIIGGGIGMVYSYLGGMVAITLTDCVQWLFMTVGIFGFYLPYSISKAGGLSALSQNLKPEYFSVTNIGWESIFTYFVIYTLGMLVDQSMWQRMFTGKDIKTSRTGTIAAGVYCMAYSIAVTVIGMCAAIVIPGLENPQDAFSTMALSVVPPIITGVIFAGALSAIMSTMSGPFLSVATLIMNDMILPAKKELNDKQKYAYTKLFMLAAGAFTLICALWIQDVLVALDVAYAILVGGILAPVLAALFWKRATKKGSVSGMAVGSIVTVGGLIKFGITAISPLMYGLIAGTICLIVVSLATPQEANKLEEYLQGNDQ